MISRLRWTPTAGFCKSGHLARRRHARIDRHLQGLLTRRLLDRLMRSDPMLSSTAFRIGYSVS